MRNNKFSKKFYIGVILIIISLIIGKITQATFMIYFDDKNVRNFSVTVYLISWIPFLWGIAWAGRETFDKYNMFFTIKYYKRKMSSNKNSL